MEALLLMIDTVVFALLVLWIVRKEARKPPQPASSLFAFRTGPAEPPKQNCRLGAVRVD